MRSILIVMLLTSRAFADDRSDAERLYNEGQVAFDRRDYDGAVSAWQRSYDLSHEPDLLYNLGQAYRLRAQRSDCQRSAESYRAFIELAPTSDQRAAAEMFAHEMERCALEAERPLKVEPVKIDPIIVTVPTQTPSIAIKASTPIVVDRGSTKRMIGIGMMGGGALLVATGMYFGREASSLGSEVTRACTSGCDWSIYGAKQAEGKSAQTRQYIFDGLGAATIIGGGILWWSGAHDTVMVTPRSGGAALSWSGSW